MNNNAAAYVVRSSGRLNSDCIICPKCNHPNDTDANYCIYCGIKLNNASITSQEGFDPSEEEVKAFEDIKTGKTEMEQQSADDLLKDIKEVIDE